MVKNHLKRINSPRSWRIKRKKSVWILKPNPGSHSVKESMAIGTMLKEILKVGRTSRDIKNILNHQEILIDGRRRKDLKFCVGFMDVITIPSIKKSYRILLNTKGQLIPVETKQDKKIVKIVGKTKVAGKIQLNMSDGKNLIVDKEDYHTNESLELEFPTWKIAKRYPLKEKSVVYMTAGYHVGKMGIVDAITDKGLSVRIDDKVYETQKKNIYVIGDEKPAINIG